MKRITKYGGRLVLATMTALAGTFAVAGEANAATSPIAACGGGSYHEIGRHDLGKEATVHLLYDGTTNCVVTWRTTPGQSQSVLAASIYVIAKDGGSQSKTVENKGKFEVYAGPVKVAAKGLCVVWSGAVGSTQWTSGPSHCG